MNYIEEATSTLSGKYVEGIDARDIKTELLKLIIAGQKLDKAKKAIFYGANVFRKGENLDLSGFGEDSKTQRDILHGMLGLVTECSEVAENLLDVLNKGNVDVVNLSEELGDLMWYMAVIMQACDLTFEKVQEINIKKLRARYGKKFSAEAAKHRDLDNERSILETETRK